MKIEAKNATAYLAAVDEPRRRELERVRALVRAAVPAATESVQWGMLGYAIDGRPFAALAAQKGHLGLYLMDLYTQPALRARHAAALAGLKMGKSCIRFARADELPLDVIAAILREAPHVTVERGTLAKPAPPKKTPPKRTPKKR